MIRVDFRCENCRVLQTDIVVESDATVTCSDCEHNVDVGVYLGPEMHDEIERDRLAALNEDRLDAEIKDILREQRTWLD